MLDVGCGSGQSTAAFASHFNKAIGIDPSQSQIKKAIGTNQSNNIHFQVPFLNNHMGTIAFDIRPDHTFFQSNCNKADRHKSRAPSLQRQTDRQTDRPTDLPTDRPTRRLIESRARD